LLARKQSYRDAGLEYFRPWLFVISNGMPIDPARFAAAAARLRALEKRRGISTVAVGVGGADLAALAELSAVRQPVSLLV
jgi:uncharacterized protein YegL